MADNHLASNVHFRPVIAPSAKCPGADCLAAIAFVYFSLTFRTGSAGELREWM
jgi:hypothetical protein